MKNLRPLVIIGLHRHVLDVQDILLRFIDAEAKNVYGGWKSSQDRQGELW